MTQKIALVVGVVVLSLQSTAIVVNAATIDNDVPEATVLEAQKLFRNFGSKLRGRRKADGGGVQLDNRIFEAQAGT